MSDKHIRPAGRRPGLKLVILLSAVVLFAVGGLWFFMNRTVRGFLIQWNGQYRPTAELQKIEADDEFMANLVAAALGRVGQPVRYDPAYIRIDYPMGDVSAETGVCTDVVIRSYRQIGIDLQQAVHEDMADHFGEYPSIWGLDEPDTNIDHRRVPNLMVFFGRHGQTLPITDDPSEYRPGDIMAWDFGDGRTHIGIVSDRVGADSRRPFVVHNAGRGPVLEDVLFRWKIIGHFRYRRG